jgi:hypothetical protein
MCKMLAPASAFAQIDPTGWSLPHTPGLCNSRHLQAASGHAIARAQSCFCLWWWGRTEVLPVRSGWLGSWFCCCSLWVGWRLCPLLLTLAVINTATPYLARGLRPARPSWGSHWKVYLGVVGRAQGYSTCLACTNAWRLIPSERKK